MFDLVFRNCRLVDGTGSPWFWGDLAVEDGKIARMGDLDSVAAHRAIDGNGAVLAPGFIDIHTHSDFTLPRHPRAAAMVRQGVTTQVVGNCGFSPFPLNRQHLDLVRDWAGFIGEVSWEWTTAGDYIRFLEGLPLASTVALQAGHGAVRIAVMGFDNRPPTDSELEAMKQLVAACFEQGVVGFSSGLIYAPSSYAHEDELAELASVAKRFGGFYSSHIRGEGETLFTAVEEALSVGRRAGVPVQLSHHKSTGSANWGNTVRSLTMIDDARRNGLDVSADQYPYDAASTTLTSRLPGWVLDGGIGAMVSRLQDPATFSRAVADLAASRGTRQPFEPGAIMLAQVPEGPDKRLEGLRLNEVAALTDQSAAEAALHLVRRYGGAVLVVLFVLSEDDVQRVMRHPAVSVGSDGWTLDPSIGGKPHPRSYGSFARVLGKYVRDEGVLPLEEAVRKMTSLPASRLRAFDRGLLRPGCIADLVLFDPATVCDRATFEAPHQYCEGVSYVVVNGKVVIDAGEDTGVTAGSVLRGHGAGRS